MRHLDDRFIEIRPGIFRTTVTEETNFAGEGVNIHFIPDEEGCLLVDTGFPTEIAKKSIVRTLGRLGISPKQTRLFITHAHPDHNGLAPWCRELGMRIFMNKEEYSVSQVPRPSRNTSLLLFGGLDVDRYFLEAQMNQEIRAGDRFPKEYEFEHVPAGTVLSESGRYTLETVSMAGHTRHQLGLMDRKAGILFCADEVILGTAPAVMTTKPDDGLLSLYFSTLDYIRKQDFLYLLPAHGQELYKKDGSIVAALSYIEDSYGRLCTFLLKKLQRRRRALTAYELTLMLYNEPEEEFYRNIGRRTLMTGKILSCLEYLYEHETIGRTFQGEKALYFV